MRQLLSILTFYKPYVLGSFIINIAIAIFSSSAELILPLMLVNAFFVKLFLLVFVWFLTCQTNSRRKLVFYNNIGISSFKLFSSLFLIDIFITIGFLIVVKEFI